MAPSSTTSTPARSARNASSAAATPESLKYAASPAALDSSPLSGTGQPSSQRRVFEPPSSVLDALPASSPLRPILQSSRESNQEPPSSATRRPPPSSAPLLNPSDFSSPLRLPTSTTGRELASRGQLASDILQPSDSQDTIIRSSRTDLGNPRLRSARSRFPLLNRGNNNADPNDASLNSVMDTDQTDGGGHYIWGTTIKVDTAVSRMQKFLEEFILPGEDVPFYEQRIQEALNTEGVCGIDLDCTHLITWCEHNFHNEELYIQMRDYPSEMLPISDTALNTVARKIAQSSMMGLEAKDLFLRPFNLPEEPVDLRKLDPWDIDKVVMIKGIVIRSSSIIPELKEGYFRCSSCASVQRHLVDRNRIQHPTNCSNTNCNQKFTMEIIHNRCTYADKQLIRIQELPDHIPDGQTPHTVTVCIYDDLTDSVRPGDRVLLTGIYRASTVRTNSRQRETGVIYRTYLDVLHVGKLAGKRVTESGDSEHDLREKKVDWTPEQAREMEEMARRDDIYDILIRSFGPNIYELDHIKKGLLCQLFGGSNKNRPDQGFSVRGELNVLLCGDPATSKSQLLQYSHKVSPCGVYTVGKGSSAVGLTAYVTRDPETKQYVLESGALVLSDGGLCCIDEFDKMSDQTRSVLHEVMEQHTVSIAKAGIIATLNARTAVLASANPKESKWNPRQTIADNLNLPPTLVSRFDLLYLLLDRPEEGRDRRLAQHIVKLFGSNQDQQDTGKGAITLSQLELMRYIAYAKSKCNPLMSPEAGRELQRAYVDGREKGAAGKGRTIMPTPRTLESYMRIAEALAKMRLGERVEVKDVLEAVELWQTAMNVAATDPVTGLVDLDNVVLGFSTEGRRRELENLKQEVMRYLRSNGSSMIKFTELVEGFNKQTRAPTTSNMMKDALRQLEDERRVTCGDLNSMDFLVELVYVA